MQPWDFWEALRSQHVCGSTVPTRYDSYLKNSLGNLNITFLFLERFCLQETNLARPSGDVILLMLWTRRWHAGLGSSQKHKDIKSPGFPPHFADVTPLLHYPRWDSASGELSSCGSLPALLQLLILQVGGRKEHDNVCTGKNYPLLLGHMAAGFQFNYCLILWPRGRVNSVTGCN